MFTTKTKSILLVLVMLVSAAGVAFAAAPSVDTETTGTSQTSDLTDGSTQTYNETTSSNFSWIADSPNASLEIKQNGTALATYEPDHYATNDSDGDGNTDEWFYNVSLADDGSDYTGLSADANENVTLTFTMANNTEASNPDTTNVTIYFKNSDTEAFTRADTAKVAEAGTLSSLSLPFSNDSEPKAAKATQTVGVTSNTTTVTVHSNQQNLTDALGETHSAAKDSGYTTEGAVEVDGDLVPLYTSSSDAPDWMDNQTYATVDSSGVVTVHNLDTTSSTVDVTVRGNDAPGFFETFNMLRSYDAGTLNAVQLADVDTDGDQDYEEA